MLCLLPVATQLADRAKLLVPDCAGGKIMWLMVFLHFMACFWVGLGRQEGGWVSVHRPGASDVEQQPDLMFCTSRATLSRVDSTDTTQVD